MNIKRTIGKLLLLGLGGILGLLFGELLVRQLYPQQLIRPCTVNDPEMAFKGVPDCNYYDDWTPEFFEYQVNLNNYGLRMEADISPKDTNLILCLGDSFTYGLGVDIEDAFMGLLQNEPERTKSSQSYQFANAGFPGYSTGHCTKLLQRLKQNGLKPSKVVYFMYFNDLFDNVNQDINYRAFNFDEREDGQIDLSPTKVYSSKKRLWHSLGIADFLYKNSHTFMLVKNILSSGKHAYQSVDPRKNVELKEEEIALIQKVALAHINYLQKECNKDGAEFVVAWIPCWLELPLENDLDWYNNFPFQSFKEKLVAQVEGKEGVKFIDPTENLRLTLDSLKRSISDYYFAEGHYNEKGNALYYEAVTPLLLDQLSQSK